MSKQNKRVDVRFVPNRPGELEVGLYPEDLEVVELFAKRAGVTPEQFLAKLLVEDIEKATADLPELKCQVEQKKGRRRG